MAMSLMTLERLDAIRLCVRSWVLPGALGASLPAGAEVVALSALAVILFGHVLAAVPLSRLGQNGGAGYSTLVLGYDNSRGEWSLLATTCIWLPLVLLLPLLPPAALPIVALVCSLLLGYYFLGMHAAHPGGPREHRILREPQWEDKTHFVAAGWRCAIAEESHAVTEAQLKGCELTGEPYGRQIWHKPPAVSSDAHGDGGGRVSTGFNPQTNPNPSDLLWREQRMAAWRAAGKTIPDASWKTGSTREAVRKAMAWYNVLQADDGHWAGDYGGPHFLMPGLIVVWYVTGRPDEMLSADSREAMAHYLRVHQQLDGGWGMHIESPSTMFGSCLCYIALRLLGATRDEPAMVKARVFIHSYGGGIYTGSWAKFYMCLLGVMDWEGHHPIPPELWLLPDWLPFHPGRLWCHCRMVYLPMCFLYGSRFVYPDAETDPLIASLRSELYCQPYASIDWPSTRELVAPIDNYSPVHPLMRVANAALALYEHHAGALIGWLRPRGLAFAREYIGAEDLQTNFICIGPVNKSLNMLAAFVQAGCSVHSDSFRRHLARVADYLWVSEDGMKMQGYNGSQGWDTSFALQAFAEAGLCDEFPQMVSSAYAYLEKTQILCSDESRKSPACAFEDSASRKRFYRHVSEGGWPFSSAAHGWPISDCTAEGLKAVLAMRNVGCIRERCNVIPDERLFKAVHVILTLQNTDGGFATYENNRGYRWFEWLNPSEVFGDIMIDYSYVECSMASLSALYAFQHAYPEHRSREVGEAIAACRRFIKSIQRADGSWYGSWGCCFTYGTWFGVEGLVLSGEPRHSDSLARACAFLVSTQNPNGGWGEDFTSCYDKSYARQGMERWGSGGSGVVNTAWALLALMAAHSPNRDAIRRGVEYLLSQQRENGDWAQEGIAGVFNRACGISYTQYRNIFPLWALARYAHEYEC